MAVFNLMQTGTSTGASQFQITPYQWGPYMYFQQLPASSYGQRITNFDYYFYANVSIGSGGTPSTDIRWGESARIFVGSHHSSGWQTDYGQGGVPLNWIEGFLRDGGRMTGSGGGNQYTLTVFTEKSQYSPYIRVGTEPAPITIANLSPVSGTRTVRTQPNTFSWSIAASESVIGSLSHASAYIEWRVTGSGQSNIVNVPVLSANANFQLPANTFTSNNVQYRVSATSNGGYTAVSEWVDLVTDDLVSGAIGVSPNGVAEDVTGVQFSWQHVIQTGTPPTGFNIQYSTNNGSSWIELVTGTGSTTTWRSAHNQIPSGNIVWRVRTQNSTGNWGTFSEPVSAIVRVSPDTPILTSYPGVPKPTFVWNAPEQAGFQLQLLTPSGAVFYDSEEIYSVSRNFTYPGYLNDGSYVVRVRVITTLGVWSAWGQANLNVRNVSPGTIALTTRVTCKNTVYLSWSANATFSGFYVLRNDEPVAYLPSTATSYEDCNANLKNTYMVRGIVNPNYSDSNKSTDTICVEDAQISLVNSSDIQHLRKRIGARPLHQEGNSVSVAYQHYEGRVLPVAYRSIQKSITHEFEFSFKCGESYDKLISFNNQLVVYKDCLGTLVVGNLEIGNISHGRSTTIQFEIVEVESGEVISYAQN